MQLKINKGMPPAIANQKAASEVISKQQKSTSLPKNITFAMRDMWGLQSRFSQRNGGKAFRLLAHPRFRAAYDFLCLRAESGLADKALATWWTDFQELNETEQRKMVSALQPSGNGKKKRRRRKPKENPVVKND